MGAYRQAVDSIVEGNFIQEKIDNWMTELSKVYNRGFSDGYYLGKLLPDWAASSGSKATEEKEFIGTVDHYYPKTKIAQIKMQSGKVSKGDQLIITGKSTGAIRTTISIIQRDHQEISTAEKSDLITIPFSERVRKNDKVYLVKARLN